MLKTTCSWKSTTNKTNHVDPSFDTSSTSSSFLEIRLSLLFLLRIIHWSPRYTHQVDAIAIALPVRQIVTCGKKTDRESQSETIRILFLTI